MEEKAKEAIDSKYVWEKLTKSGILVDVSLFNNDEFAVFSDTAVTQARKKLSKTIVFKIFVLISSCLSITEPILIGFKPTGLIFKLQIAVLALSSITFVLDLILASIYYQSPQIEKKLTPFQIMIAFFEGEVILDAFCITFGWCTIFTNPGVAALRCLRVFRLLWYFELFPHYKDSNFDPASSIFSLRKASQLCLIYMKKIGQELFTQESKGGIVIIAMWLYISYLIAVVLWIETPSVNTGDNVDTQENCRDLNICFITMIRLSFYDGNGFDFMQTLAQKGWVGYTILVFLYMIISAIILLNGLIGIFGGAFNTADDESKALNDTKSIATLDQQTVGPAPPLMKFGTGLFSRVGPKRVIPQSHPSSPPGEHRGDSNPHEELHHDHVSREQLQAFHPAQLEHEHHDQHHQVIGHHENPSELIELIRSLKQEIHSLKTNMSRLEAKFDLLVDLPDKKQSSDGNITKDST